MSNLFVKTLPLPDVEYLHPAAESYRTIFASLQAGVAYTLTFSARSATGGWLIVYTASIHANLYQQTPPLTTGYAQYAFTFTSTVGQALMAYFATADIDMISIRLARTADMVQFGGVPLRDGSGMAPELFQVRGMDSLGDEYVYDKSTITRNSHTITLPRETDAVLSALKAFDTASVHGSRDTFTWDDETGEPHTVRLTGGVKHAPVGPNQNRIELTLEEDLPWTPPSPPADFAAARAAKTGTCPVWILRLTIAGTDYYLSAPALTITGWGGQTITTLPWVNSLGQIRETITGDLNEIRLAEFSCAILDDPAAATGINDLIEAHTVENSPAYLYQWYLGLNAATSPPEEKLRGRVREVEQPDETAAELVIEGQESWLQQYLGTRITREAFPRCDPLDIGKIIPIVYGTGYKVQAVGVDVPVNNSLPGAITSGATSFDVGEDGLITAGMTIAVNTERILVGSVSGATLSGCTRGYGGTTAVSHLAGTVVWEYQAELVYLVNDDIINSMPSVWREMGGIHTALSLTTGVARYFTGHASFPGRAAIGIPFSYNMNPNQRYLVYCGRTTIREMIDVFGDLHDRAGQTAVTQTGSFPAAYQFDGVITEYRRYIDWLDTLAFQCRAYYRRTAGAAYLIVRPDSLSSVRTISAVSVERGVKVHKRGKVPLSQVINKIEMFYSRDWSQSAGVAAYRRTSTDTDDTSITANGICEQPDMFLFDFVGNQSMADSVRDFYLARYGTRGWQHTFRVFLDQSDLLSGQAVTLGFAGSAVGEIEEAGIIPGDTKTIDVVEFTVRV